MVIEFSNRLKKIIFISVIIIILATIIVVVLPLIIKKYQDKNDSEKSLQQKVQEEFDRMEALEKGMNITPPTQEEIQREFDKLK